METLTLRNRVFVALLIGAAFGAVTWWSLSTSPEDAQGRDFTYPWLAGRFLLHGQNPYLAIRTATTPYAPVFLYPLSAAIVALPFSWTSSQSAAILFVGISFAALTFVLSRGGWWRLVIFASAPAYSAAASAQWSTLLMACSLVVPAVGLLMCKPTIGIPLLAFQSSRRAILSAIVGGLVLAIVSFLLVPTWPLDWLHTLRGAGRQYRAPMLTPLGAVIALAALRWRQPEARLLLVLAILPQNAFFYDQFVLLLIPKSRREALIAATCSTAAYLLVLIFARGAPNLLVLSAQLMPVMITGLYLPALVMVLRRPNEGAVLVPRLERLLRPLPLWLRGAPSLSAN